MPTFASVPFTSVSIEGAFWRERLDTVLTRTIPSQYEQLTQHGLLESLTIPQPPPPLRIPVKQHGISTQIFWDSDVGKWIEAASYALAHRRDATIETQIEQITDWLQKAQLPDGYLNCWFIGRALDNRWTNLRDCHELYCAGHLLEGAIAYYQATNRRRLLDVLQRYVDHIAQTFGRGPGQKRGYSGHPEIELALIKLYHAARDRKHLDLAAYFIDERGQQPPHYFDLEALARGEDPKAWWFHSYEYNQSHRPVREQDKVVGHAVRAMYLYAAMADLAAEFGDDSLRRACESLWRDATTKRMYITAGLGPSASNEGFTHDYDLPNDTAYAESCASVALAFWAQRMLNLDCDGAYADVMEQALYNGALSGLSRDGTHYFYENPLESDGSQHRWEWHPCPCCTMNVSRVIASVGGYFYSVGTDVVAVHLYGGNAARLDLAGRTVRLRQDTDYPWSGRVRIEVDPGREATFALRLRIPGWARSHDLQVNGAPAPGALVRGYRELHRTWQAGDVVTLDLPMPVERLYAHPDVRAGIGRVCLKRGPLVYCVEQVDNPDVPVGRLRLRRAATLRAEVRPELLEGIVTLEGEAELTAEEGWEGRLYRSQPPTTRKVMFTAVPYYFWNNRGANRMLVWLHEA
jgi:uncharacterized protein